MAHTFDDFRRIPSSGLDSSDPVTGDFSCGASATVLVLMIMYDSSAGTRDATAPTYNSIELTQVKSTQGGDETYAEMWYLLDPPTVDVHQVSIPNSTEVNLMAVVASGSAQSGYSSVFDDSGSTTTTGSDPNVSVTTTANGDIIFANVASGDDNFSPTGRTGTSLGEEDLGTWGIGAQYYVMAGSGAQAMSWTEAMF